MFTTTTPAPMQQRAHARIRPLLVIGAAAACLVAIGLVALGGNEYAVAGVRGPDAFTRYGLIIVRVLAEIGAVLCVGSLLFAAFMVPPQRSGELSADGRSALRTAGWSAALWSVCALLSVPFTVADVFTKPVGDVLEFERMVKLAFALEQTKAWMVTAGIAFLLAVTARLVRTWRPATVLLGVSVLGLIPVAASGHSSGGGDHDLATTSLLLHVIAAALWVGGLVALLAHGRRKGEHLALAAGRFSKVALTCWVVMAVSGVINALVRLPIAGIFGTSYGLLAIGKIAALLLLGMFGYWQRKRGIRDIAQTGSGRALVRLAAFEVLVMMITIGLATALARTSPPHDGVQPQIVELNIGYALDGPPTLARIMTDWRFDLILGTAALVLAALYLIGVRRSRAGGNQWPVWRTVAWLGGCAEILLATSSGIGRYAPAMFGVDMVSHMLLSVLAPILLVLGSPVTLALHVVRRNAFGPREWLLTLGRSPAVRFMAHPVIVAGLFAGSFYALYFSGLFDYAIDQPLAHVAMNAYLLLMGYVFFWAVLGTDPFPRPIPLRARQSMVFVAVPLYALFGFTLMSADTAFGDRFYRTLNLPWVADLLTDQRLGGSVTWGAGVVPLLVVAAALVTPWSKEVSRRAS